jgi:hypothetical protein
LWRRWLVWKRGWSLEGRRVSITKGREGRKSKKGAPAYKLELYVEPFPRPCPCPRLDPLLHADSSLWLVLGECCIPGNVVTAVLVLVVLLTNVPLLS